MGGSVLAFVWVLGASGAAAGEAGAIFDVPKVENVAIDGKADDWGDRGFRVEALVWLDGPPLPANDLDTRFRLGWDARGLLLLVQTADDVPLEEPDPPRLWVRDSVELFLAERKGGRQCIQFLVAPGRDPKLPTLRHHAIDRRQDEGLKKTPPAITAAASSSQSGYVMEVLLPWSNLGVQPAEGMEAAFQLYVNDSDAPGRWDRAVWFPLSGAQADSARMHRLRLAERPSPPVRATATGGLERFRHVVVDVTATGELAGRAVSVRHGGKVLGRGELVAERGRAVARVRLPMPPRDRPYGRLEFLVGEEPTASLELPDPAKARAREFIELRPVFRPHAFAGKAPPECEFERPLYVEQLIGPYRIETELYDAAGRRVTAADAIGRYGAVVRARGEDGRTYTRYVTLYRAPERFVPRMQGIAGSVELPKAFGIDPNVAAGQRASVMEVLKWALADHNDRSDGLAELLAALHETQPGGPPADAFTRPESRDRQWWVTLTRKLNGNAKRFTEPFVCPRPISGEPAPVLREGTAEQAGMKPDTAKRLDDLLTEWAGNTDQAFIACVARRGIIVHHKAYGTRDGKPMTPSTRSWMASITKLMQGACIMMLVDRGLVDLDAEAATYLPELKGAKTSKPITVRCLLTHTAGMWGHWGDEADDLAHRVAEYAPHLEVGVKHEYNGMSLSLASKVLEQVSGEALPAFYKAHLLDPLRCADTEVTTSSWDARSTAMDMAKIGQMLLNGGAYGKWRFFSQKARDAMLPRKLTMILGPETDKVWGIGCTWMSTDVFGPRTFGHGSAASATIRIDPDNELVVTMTRNTAGRNFGTYHGRFLKLVADCLADAKRPAAGRG